MPDKKPNWLSRRAQATRYGRTPRTIRRWEVDPDLNYPPGIEINGRWYRREDQLNSWDAQRAKLSRPSIRKSSRVPLRPRRPSAPRLRR